MKISTFLCIMFLLFCRISFAQVGVNSDNSAPDPSAGLDVNFNNKGLLPPRMTSMTMNAIVSPAAGLMVYNTTVNSICWFNGTAWIIGTNRDGKNCGSVNYGGKTYNSVIIGLQCWMTENLNIGAAIPGNQDQADNGTIEKYCYNDNSGNCDVYGGLYQWAEVVQYLGGATNTTSWNPVPAGPVQGICPTGWHLPSNAEWTALITYLGGESVAGGKMKETGTTHWISPNTGATNSSGFTALPGGYAIYSTFTAITIYGNYWSSDELIPTLAYSKMIYHDQTIVNPLQGLKVFAYSVRCLRN
jgi:uncharacterized protein (TIGR02145 family)